MKHFFIFALPRCRTRWLANLLTTDRTLCVHNTSAFLPPQLRVYLAVPGYDFVGSAEVCPDTFTKLANVAPEIVEGSPLVVIRHPEVASPTSTRQKMVHFWGPEGKNPVVYDRITAILEHISTLPNCMTVDLRELDDLATVEAVYRHCLPGVRFDAIRAQLLAWNIVKVKYTDIMTAQREQRLKKIALGIIPPRQRY